MAVDEAREAAIALGRQWRAKKDELAAMISVDRKALEQNAGRAA